MSRGKGTSGFSPVSTTGMLAFLISFSTNPSKEKKKNNMIKQRKQSRNRKGEKQWVLEHLSTEFNQNSWCCQQWFSAHYVSNAHSITHLVCGPSPHTDGLHSQTSSGTRSHRGSTAIQWKRKGHWPIHIKWPFSQRQGSHIHTQGRKEKQQSSHIHNGTMNPHEIKTTLLAVNN